MPRGGGMGGGFGGGRGFGGGFGGGHRHHHHHIHPRRRVGGLFGFGLLPFVTGAAVGASMASGSSYREPETVVYVQPEAAGGEDRHSCIICQKLFHASMIDDHVMACIGPTASTGEKTKSISKSTEYYAVDPTAPPPHPQASHELDYVNVNYGPPPEYSQYPQTSAIPTTQPGSAQNAPPPYSAEAPAPYSAEAPAPYSAEAPAPYSAEAPVYEPVPVYEPIPVYETFAETLERLNKTSTEPLIKLD